MTTETRFSKTLATAFALLMVSALFLTPASAQAPQVKSLGLENPGKTMNIHVMLNLRNESQLQSLVKDIQDPSSPNYHKFLTKQQFAAQFAPTAADSKRVADYLTANGLKVTHISSHNLVVSATGTVGALQKTFNTQIEKLVDADGQTFNRPMIAPTISPSLSSLVKNVVGLHVHKMHSDVTKQVAFKNKKAVPVTPVKFNKSKPKPNGLFFPGDCFSGNNDVLTLGGPGLEAIYSGSQYPDQGCGYSPAEMQHAYGFDTAIQAGNDGTGQIITIVDPYGSYSIVNDVNAFSTIYGLPALVPGVNFLQYYNITGSTPDCVIGPTTQCGAEVEVTLDVEWAHAMAPGATIALITTATFNDSDLLATDELIVEASLSGGFPTGVVSHSYGEAESQADPTILADQYSVIDFAASFGMSMNYSSGDWGDFTGAPFFTPSPDVSFPAGAPNGTSVGGTSLALTSTGAYKWEEGWGNNVGQIFLAPPSSYFYAGAGGGTSQSILAPTWQQMYLHNTYRQQPDVSMDADPFTGAEVIFTCDFGSDSSNLCVEPIGGTSLSCPMFSAVWSLAEQKAGTPYIGNAATVSYYINANYPGSFNDVQPLGSGHNAHGTIFYPTPVVCPNGSSSTTCSYSQWDLAGNIQNTPIYGFYESIWNAQEITVTFGTDSSLFTAKGWDNVTGVGSPKGATFLSPF